MKIEDLKELQKVIKSCRQLGVQSIKIGDVEFHLGELPTKIAKNSHKSKVYQQDPGLNVKAYAPGGITDQTKLVAELTAMASDELTEEQLLNWSSAPEGQQEQA